MANNPKKYAGESALSALVTKIKELFVSKIDFDSSLSNKADKSHTHSIADTTNLQSTLDGKVPTSRTINNKALTANIALSASDVGAAPSSHEHSDKYYQKSEVDAALANKSDKTHNHDSAYSTKDHNHDGVYALEGHNHDSKYETKSDASTKLTEAKTYADNAANTVKNDLLNNAGAAYDTLKELGDLIDDNTDAIDALEIVAADKADKTHKHTVSDITDLTVTATELNYMDGVTSNVQAQLDSKANSATLIGRAGEGNGAEIFNDYTNNTATGREAHAEGYSTTASGMRSHAEGQSSTASAQATHAEGYNTQATATAAHSEGYYTEATGKYSHAEGYMSKAQEQYAHAEGYSNTASGEASHAEGYATWADGNYSHTEGRHTTASGEDSHAEGFYTHAASNQQHVQGKYNIIDRDANDVPLNTYAHIVGNGTSNTKRSNAHTIDWNGNGWFAGDVLVGGTSQDDASKVITEADQKWNLLYDSGEISAIANSISNIDVSGYTNIQVLVRIYNDGDSVGSRNGSAIFKCANGKNYQFPVWANMFSKSINTVYVMATFNLVDGWLICPCASRLIGDANTFEDTEGGTASSLSPVGSGMMKCTSPLSTLTISSLDQNSNYYFGMGSRVIVWGWNG